MTELGATELQHYNKIEELQQIIETFVTDIGYDVNKFIEHSPKRRRSEPPAAAPSTSDTVKDKISTLYSLHKVPSTDFTTAFQSLPGPAKLELYTFLVENNEDLPQHVSLAELQDLDPEEKRKSREEAREKSKLELLKLERDSKRRRQRFKGVKRVQSSSTTLMDKHRDLVKCILDDYKEQMENEEKEGIKQKAT